MEFIYGGLSKSGGLYKITNKINGRTYYGSTKCFQVRWSRHATSIKHGKHSNKFLQADFNKCGTDAFIFEVLEVVEGTREDRLLKEEVYLKQYFDNGKQCYNLCDRAISREGYSDIKKRKTRSDKGSGKQLKYQRRTRMAAPWNKGKKGCYTPELIAKWKKSHTGKEVSQETKAKMGASRRGKKHSEKTKAELSIKKLGALNPNFGPNSYSSLHKAKTYDVKLLSSTGEIFGPITNLLQFCLKHSLTASALRLVITGKVKHHKGWTLLPLAINEVSQQATS